MKYSNETWKVYELNDLPWEPLNETTDFDKNQVVFKLQDSSRSPISFDKNGSLSLSVRTFSTILKPSINYAMLMII